MDNSSDKFSIRQRIKSFEYAGRGIATLFRTAHNARIHAVAAVLAVIASVCLRISAMEWVAVSGCIVAVMAAEAINSAVEALADAITQKHNPLIGAAKDLAAAAVLILAIGAVIIAAIIFIPKIIILLTT